MALKPHFDWLLWTDLEAAQEWLVPTSSLGLANRKGVVEYRDFAVERISSGAQPRRLGLQCSLTAPYDRRQQLMTRVA